MKATDLLAAALIALPIFAQQTTQPRERVFTHTVLAPGIAASAPFPVPLRTVRARIVVRNFAVGQGTAKDVPNPNFAVMELQSGHVFTTVGGDRQERVPGDFWAVEKGATISFENPHPNSAGVIRVTYFELNP
jgi:hypothetical protein